MLRNYLLTSVRHLTSQKAYATINILGLSIGIASVIVIGAFVEAHLDYDGGHVKADRIHRVLMETHTPDAGRHVSRRTDGPLAATLEREFPEVEKGVRVHFHQTWVASAEDRGFELRGAIGDPAFFDIFDFTTLTGTPQAALAEPYAILITESVVPLLFPDGGALGSTLTLTGPSVNGEYTVAGILRDIENSSVRATFYVSTMSPDSGIGRLADTWNPGAQYRAYQTWLLLKEGVSRESFESKIQDVIARYLGPDDARKHSYHVQPLNRIHLYRNQDYGGGPDIITRVYTYSLVATLILAIACINYINLATARASRRAREIGLRKTVGGSRRQLIAQFLGESVLTALLALGVGIVIALLYLPEFRDIASWQAIDITLDPATIVRLSILAVAVGVIAGLYPALVLARIEPAAVVRGEDALWSRRGWARILVVVQFAVSTFIIVGTVTVRDQIQWSIDRNQGYDWQNVVETPILWVSRTLNAGKERGTSLNYRYDTVQQAFLSHPGITHATATRFPQGAYFTQGLHEVEASSEGWNFGIQDTDEHFFDFFGIEILAGRVYANRKETLASGESIRVGTQFEEYVINAKAVEMLGWKTDKPNPYADAIGKRIRAKGKEPGVVVGVCADYHAKSVHAPIGPMALNLSPAGLKFVQLRLAPGDPTSAMDHIEKTWRTFLPSRPFEHTTLDHRVSIENVLEERRLARVLDATAAVAIFVSCLGLLGLVSYITERRKREIGIRKVLGAGTSSVTGLLTRDFVGLILLANVLAWPLAWMWADNWLNTFVYRMRLGPTPFLLTGLLSLLAAGLMIGYHTYRAASRNPVDTIRR